MQQNLITTIKSGAFSGLPNLEELYLNDNQITSIEPGAFSGLDGLHELRLYSSQITSIAPGTFTGLANLDALRMYDNQITSIEPGDFAGLDNLATLYLADNLITSIDSGDFSGPNHLWSLELQNNQIATIEPGAFSGMTGLGRLYLHGNQITCIEKDTFAGLTGLEILVLEDNQISSIESGAFAGMDNLEKLNMYFNNLTHLDFSGATFDALSQFDIAAGNSVESVDLSGSVLSEEAFDALMNGLDNGDVISMLLTSADLSDVYYFTPMYTLDDLVTLDLAYAILGDVDHVDELVAALESHALDNLTISPDQWDLMDPATQSALTAWDAAPGNTLTIVPEPATWVLMSFALCSLALFRRRRS